MMIGFIGAGNMGQALIRSLSSQNHKKGKTNSQKIRVFDPNPQVRKHLPRGHVSWAQSAPEILQHCTTVFLCIKPKDVTDFFSENRMYFHNQIVISIIAGLTISSLRKAARLPHLKVCRIMPNLAAAIGHSAGTVTYSRNLSVKEKKSLARILSCSGMYIETPENLVNAVTGVSGCGPAFVFLFVEALTQAAVRLKVPRKQALRFAVQTLIGAGTLLQASDREPLELTSQVTSPGGMTIEGVHWLNKSNFQEIVMEAVFRAHAKAKLLFK